MRNLATDLNLTTVTDSASSRPKGLIYKNIKNVLYFYIRRLWPDVVDIIQGLYNIASNRHYTVRS